jgi:hypothetical protein
MRSRGSRLWTDWLGFGASEAQTRACFGGTLPAGGGWNFFFPTQGGDVGLVLREAEFLGALPQGFATELG